MTRLYNRNANLTPSNGPSFLAMKIARSMPKTRDGHQKDKKGHLICHYLLRMLRAKPADVMNLHDPQGNNKIRSDMKTNRESNMELNAERDLQRSLQRDIERVVERDVKDDKPCDLVRELPQSEQALTEQFRLQF